jgi:hypothetical protein
VFGPNEPQRALKAGKVVHAVRVAAPPTIDGRLDDEPWIVAPAAVDLTQRDPDNGQAMTRATRIQFAYDDRYLYVAVTCVDDSGDVVATGLGRRDELPPTDMITLAFDPRHDHQTGYAFQTNPSGWQGDFSTTDDDRNDRDYNGVWDVRTTVTATGWSAEFRIPFSQVRFTASPDRSTPSARAHTLRGGAHDTSTESVAGRRRIDWRGLAPRRRYGSNVVRDRES